MSEPYLALQVVMMPRDANPQPTLHPSGQFTLYSTIFGGVMLSYIDQAGAIGARREVIRAGGPPPVVVTVAMNRVEFKKPVLVGDVVRFLTRVVRLGRTSITMQVSVEVERGKEVLQVTEAEVVYVGIDPNTSERKPIPLLPAGGH
jgi:acyl-CoA thioesterase YciA